MNVDRAVFVLAGSMVLRQRRARPGWSAPIGCCSPLSSALNMLQAAFTGFCPAAIIFRKLGLKSGCAFACGEMTARRKRRCRL